ncbi:MAG: DUF853 family protein [Candidatus Bathyarchaeota archaeon]|nr:DUF853 family protein [Candidatus Bathyarchaeota archaeon]
MMSRLNSYVDQEAFEKLFALYLMEDNAEEKALIRSNIESVLGVYVPQLLFSRKPVLQAPLNSDGQILIGNVMQGERELSPFGISPQTINKHIAIFGATGSGKTSLLANILRQLSKEGINWMAFDFKRDLRGFAKEGVWVFRWDALRINPLQPPPGVSPEVWMTIVPDIFAHCFYWFSPSENYLMEFLSQIYGKSRGKYPTIKELYDFIVKREERNRKRADYFAVVTNRLASMLTVMKGVINVHQGMPLEEVFAHSAVIEVDQLRRDEANFLVEYLLAYLFYYRMVNGQRSKLAHVIVCDEANRWFYPQRRWKDTTVELGMPFIETVPQIIRDYCEGMIFASQGCLSQTVMANTNLKIVGFLGDGEDIESLSKSMSLNDAEQAAITKLETGNWLVAKAGEKPFIVRSAPALIDKTVTDEELKGLMQPITAKLTHHIEEHKEPVEQQAERFMPSISENALTMIIDVNAHPFKGFVARCQSLNVSGRKAEAIKAELLIKGLVKEISTKLGKSNRLTKFLLLTELGTGFLRKRGYDTSLWKRTGYQNFEHQLYCVLIAYAYKQSGYQISIEKEISSERRVDVLAKKNIAIAVEVELGPFVLEDELKALRYVDKLIIAVKTETALDNAKLKLEGFPQEMQARVRVCMVGEFIHELKSNYTDDNSGNNPIDTKGCDSSPFSRNESGIGRNQ